MSEEHSLVESEPSPSLSFPITSETDPNQAFRYRSGFARNQSSIKQIIYNSLQDILSAYIDPLIKQWIKNVHLAGLILIGLFQKINSKNIIPVPHQVSGLKLSQTHRDILAKGLETELISGFTSKSGKNFSAYLKLDRNGKIQYRFPSNPENTVLGKSEEIPFKPPDLIPKVLLGVELSEEVRDCLRKGIESPLVTGLKSRKGNVFSAYLKMNLNGDLKFRFPSRYTQENLEKENPNLKNEALPDSVPEPKSHTSIIQKDPLEIKEDNESKEMIKKENSSNDNFTEKTMTESHQNKENNFPMKAQAYREVQKQTSQNPSSPEFPVINNNSKNQNNNPEFKTISPVTNSEALPGPIPETILGQKLYNITLKTLESGKETELIKGFISPSGKIFDAYLKLLPPNHIQFRIPSREKDLKISSIPKIILGVSLSEQNKTILKLGHETPLLSSFRFQNGKPFQAYLRRDEKGSLIIRTPPVKKQIPLEILRGKAL